VQSEIARAQRSIEIEQAQQVSLMRTIYNVQTKSLYLDKLV